MWFVVYGYRGNSIGLLVRGFLLADFGWVALLWFLFGDCGECSGVYSCGLVGLVLLVVVCGWFRSCGFVSLLCGGFSSGGLAQRVGGLVWRLLLCLWYGCLFWFDWWLVVLTCWFGCVLCGAGSVLGACGCLVLLFMLLVFVNSVVHWFVMYCMYDLVASFAFFGLIGSCRFVVVCICL